MFRSFFFSRRWLPWSLLGTLLILAATWYRVNLDVQINEWFGTFYDIVQKMLGKPGSVTLPEFWGQLMTFGRIAMVYVTIAVLLDFFIKHYIFRWRTAMNSYYMAHWERLRKIEGAAQRVQEDTMRFARLMESLGVDFMNSVMTLIAFLPILWTLSMKVTELPWIGTVSHSLVWVAIGFALAGTVLMAVVGIRLPGLEFQNQRVRPPTARSWSMRKTTPPAPRRPWRTRCSPTCGATTSGSFSITCTSTWSSGRTCNSACWCRTSRWGRRW